MSAYNESLIKGSVLKGLVRFAIPVLLANVLQIVYSTTDLFIVGRFASTADVSGVSTGSMLMGLVTFAVFGLVHGVAVLVGRCAGAKDEEGCLRSKADVLNSLLGYMGLSSAKSTCVFIGDSRRDIEEARQAGIPTIAAAWGYGTKQDLRNAGATHIVDNLQGFKGLL